MRPRGRSPVPNGCPGRWDRPGAIRRDALPPAVDDASVSLPLPRASSPTMRSLTVALLLALTCIGAHGQDKIYKVRLPDGRILFTDKPPAGGVVVSEREVPPAPPPAVAPAPRRDAEATAPESRAAQADARLRDRAAEIDRAFAAVQAAERDLQDAKLKLEGGRAPLDGEMIGTARGRVRPSPAYQDRVNELEKGVQSAEQRLAKARDDLNALR